MADIRESGMTVAEEIEFEWFRRENEDLIEEHSKIGLELAQAPSADVFEDSLTGVFFDRSLTTNPLGNGSIDLGSRPAILRWEATDAHAEFSGQTGTPVIDVFIG